MNLPDTYMYFKKQKESSSYKTLLKKLDLKILPVYTSITECNHCALLKTNKVEFYEIHQTTNTDRLGSTV